MKFVVLVIIMIKDFILLIHNTSRLLNHADHSIYGLTNGIISLLLNGTQQ